MKQKKIGDPQDWISQETQVIHQLLANRITKLEDSHLFTAEKLTDLKMKLLEDAKEKETPEKFSSVSLEEMLLADSITASVMIDLEIDKTSQDVTKTVNEFNNKSIDPKSAREKLEYLVPYEKKLRREKNALISILSPDFLKKIQEMQKIVDITEKNDASDQDTPEQSAKVVELKYELQAVTVILNKTIEIFERLENSKLPVFEPKFITERIQSMKLVEVQIQNTLSRFKTTSSIKISTEDQQQIIEKLIPFVDILLRNLSMSIDNAVIGKKSLTEKPVEAEKTNNSDLIAALSGLVDTKKSTKEIIPPTIPESKKSSAKTPPSTTWDAIGLPILSLNGNVYGIGFYGTINKEQEMIGCIQEEEITGGFIQVIVDKLALKNPETKDSSETLHDILQQDIAQKCNIPPEIALYPTIVREYLALLKNVSIGIPLKRTLSGYIPLDDIAINYEKKIVIAKTNPRPISQVDKLPKSLPPFTFNQEEEGPRIILWDHRDAGQVFNSFYHQTLGNNIIMVMNNLHIGFIQKIIKHLQKENRITSKIDDNIDFLRRLISKKYEIPEESAFRSENLWKFFVHEEFPALPWEIKSNHIGILPSGVINGSNQEKNEIYIKRRIEVPCLKHAFIHPDRIKDHDGDVLGTFIALDIDIKKQPAMWVCPYSENEILEIMGQSTGADSKAVLKIKIVEKLNVKAAKAFNSYNLLRYDRFVAKTDLVDYSEAKNYYINEFQLQSIPLSMVADLNWNYTELDR